MKQKQTIILQAVSALVKKKSEVGVWQLLGHDKYCRVQKCKEEVCTFTDSYKHFQSQKYRTNERSKS